MRRFLFGAAAAALLAPSAASQVFVIGGGLAHDCFLSAKSGDMSKRTEDLCTRAIQTETLSRSNRAATFTNRGIVRMRNGDYDGALSDYAAAEKLNDQEGAVYLNRGAALIYQKNFSDALAPLDRAIELETQDIYAAYYNRAIARENTGDVEGAYFDFKKALELKPEWRLAELQLSRFSVN